jgi:hypothetical protein
MNRHTPLHTFVVRYRLEQLEPGQTAERRGSVIHLPGDESVAFRDEAVLIAFINRILDDGSRERSTGEDGGP